jgi:hypothetical protein
MELYLNFVEQSSSFLVPEAIPIVSIPLAAIVDGPTTIRPALVSCKYAIVVH